MNRQKEVLTVLIAAPQAPEIKHIRRLTKIYFTKLIDSTKVRTANFKYKVAKLPPSNLENQIPTMALVVPIQHQPRSGRI